MRRNSALSSINRIECITLPYPCNAEKALGLTNGFYSRRWKPSISSHDLQTTLLDELLDHSRVLRGGLARSSRAEVDHRFAILGRQCPRERLHRAGGSQNDPVRLVNPMSRVKQGLG